MTLVVKEENAFAPERDYSCRLSERNFVVLKHSRGLEVVLKHSGSPNGTLVPERQSKCDAIYFITFEHSDLKVLFRSRLPYEGHLRLADRRRLSRWYSIDLGCPLSVWE